MAKTQQKTTETKNSVADFINTIADEQKQKDTKAIAKIMKEATGFTPKMWGPAIIGFGSYHYKYESGHEGDAPLVGFSPRKAEFALYIANFDGKEELLKKFGKHKMAKSCVYIKKVADVDADVFKKLVIGSVKYTEKKYKAKS